MYCVTLRCQGDSDQKQLEASRCHTSFPPIYCCLSFSLSFQLITCVLFVCLSTQVSERVQTLSKDTEERRDLLETRLKSWEVFPVEKAREVKSFVETMERSVNLELDEDCSAEELMDQLRHLEVGGVHVDFMIIILVPVPTRIMITSFPF